MVLFEFSMRNIVKNQSVNLVGDLWNIVFVVGYI